ncbi:MAG: hypothetical protein GEV13_11735 [Rhodospirillales bacterium]|nr:hypothetical protein [Rhodospirillales bacterium]
MVDVKIKQVRDIDPLDINPLTINPLTVRPLAVHLKELNQVAPLSVESLRVDHVRHVDPLQIDQLNITSLPTVNLTMSQLPALDINVRRVPPVAVALHQQFEMCSDYAMTARVLGLPLMRLSLSGRTTITPKDCARREQSRSHERSFPDVAALGNPAIPSRAIETCTETVTHRVAPPPVRRHGVHAGTPRFGFSLQQAETRAPAADSAVNGG